jgi:hypothetical protein
MTVGAVKCSFCQKCGPYLCDGLLESGDACGKRLCDECRVIKGTNLLRARRRAQTRWDTKDLCPDCVACERPVQGPLMKVGEPLTAKVA